MKQENCYYACYRGQKNMQTIQTCLLYHVLAGAEAHAAADVYTGPGYQ